MISHVGDGNFHTSICFDPAEEGQCKEAERLKNFMVNVASAVEGTCTGEHGVGTAKLKVSIGLHWFYFDPIEMCYY